MIPRNMPSDLRCCYTAPVPCARTGPPVSIELEAAWSQVLRNGTWIYINGETYELGSTETVRVCTNSVHSWPWLLVAPPGVRPL